MDLEQRMSRRDFLRGTALSAAVLAAAACAPVSPVSSETSSAALPSNIVPIGETLPAAEEVINYASLVNFSEPGTMRKLTEEIAAFTEHQLEVEVKQLPASLRSVFDSIVNENFPFLHQIVDEIIVLSHTQNNEYKEGAYFNEVQSPMRGGATLEKIDPEQPWTPRNFRRLMVLSVPDYLLDGGDPNISIIDQNFIPYAKAEQPSTLGDIFEWFMLHEITHIVDYAHRFSTGNEVLKTATDLDALFTYDRISPLLNMVDIGNQFLESDALENRGNTITVGNTKYTRRKGGAFGIGYDDGSYKFTYDFIRSGYIPVEMRNLSDFTSLIQSGKFCNIYSIFRPDVERFADFSAWYLFNKRRGAEDKFAQVHNELIPYYEYFYKMVQESLSSGTIAASSNFN